MAETGVTTLTEDIRGMVPRSVQVLETYMSSEAPMTKADMEKAKMALSIIRTAVTVQNTAQAQERFHTSIAKQLSDGDIATFSAYIAQAVPSFPMVKKELPTA